MKSIKDLDLIPEVGMIAYSMRSHKDGIIHYIYEITEEKPKWFTTDKNLKFKVVYTINSNGHKNRFYYDDFVKTFIYMGRSKYCFKDIFTISEENEVENQFENMERNNA